MTDEPKFAPFLPSPPTAPEQPASAKKTRKPRAKPAPEVIPPFASTAPAEKKTRKPRTVPKVRSPKFDLQTILSVASQLKDADMKLFEHLLGRLQDATKGSRARVLAALEKVFA